MPTISSILNEKFRQAIQAAYGLDADPVVVPAQNPRFGDYQANFAMALTRAVSEKTGQKANPRQIGEQVKAKLQITDIASEVSIAGPGFINVRLSPDWLARQLSAVGADQRLGVEKTTTPQTVVVDYSGPNIAKELHVGHLRSTIIGDAMVRVLSFVGHEVIKQNHIGDWGTQFGMLIAYLRRGTHLAGIGESPDGVNYTDGSPFGPMEIRDLEKFYRAAKTSFDNFADFQDEARRTVVSLQSGDSEILALWHKIVDETRRHYQPLYEQLGVKLAQTDERGESFYNPLLEPVVRELKSKGIAVESEGATVIFTDGPEKAPLIIEKTGGGYLYGTTDLAAVRYRIFDLHAHRIIYFTDARQSQHFHQVFTAATMASWTSGNVSLEHAPFGTMLGEDGKPFKTRSGGTVKLKELLDEAEERAAAIVKEKNADLPEEQKQSIAHAVGIGAVKYSDLSKDRMSDYVFSWDKALAMDGNTAPYLQYAHARIQSIFRKGGTTSASAAGAIALQSPFEVALALHLLRFEEIVALVARELKPHHLCNYLYELSTRFSSFYENCPVLQSDEPVRSSRLALCAVVARTLGKGLDLLGIEHPEQM